MHILQLTDFYRPIVGGLERHVETLSRELLAHGHSTTVATLKTTEDAPDEEFIDGIRVVRIRGWSTRLQSLYANTAKPFHPTAPDPAVMAALRSLVGEESPDVVHSHGWMQYSYFPLHRPDRGPAHVVTLHDYGLTCPKKTLQHTTPQHTTPQHTTPQHTTPQPIRTSPHRPASISSSTAEPVPRPTLRCTGPGLAKCLRCAPAQYGPVKGALVTGTLRLSRPLHARADRYIAVSSAVAAGSRAGLPARTWPTVIPTMVPNGLPALAEQTKRPDFLPTQDGYLMFVGALGPHKGVGVLLEARRRMRTTPPMVLIGTPRPDSPPLDEPGITVALNVPSAQVLGAWSRASIAVVPSVWDEPLGQVAVEASLVGRPVVASAVGGLPDVVQDKVTGLLVPPGDPNALAHALDTLLEDPSLATRLGQAGRVHSRRFESSAVAPQVLDVFDDVLRQRSRTAERR
jgi:glycosyltransferase involved in cell wall biosynthesis